VEPDTGLTYRIAALDDVRWQDRLALVVPAGHATRGEHHLAGAEDVGGDEHRPLRPVPARARANEVDERHVQLVRGPERAVVGLIDRAGAVGVDDAVGCLTVVIG